MDKQRFNSLRIAMICQECAEKFYSNRPSMLQIISVRNLLFGTAAQESSLQWERQRIKDQDSRVGGYSKWQLEKGSVTDSLELLKRNPAIAVRATDFLFCDSMATPMWVSTWTVEHILDSMRINDNDYLGCLFARLHYLRVPAPIPEGLAEQARYYKKYYNTYLGAATPEQYVSNWERLCKPILGEL